MFYPSNVSRTFYSLADIMAGIVNSAPTGPIEAHDVPFLQHHCELQMEVPFMW